MRRRVVRGVAIGAVVALIILVAVASFIMYRLVTTGVAIQSALHQYNLQMQKPMFQIASVTANSTTAVISVQNIGPSAAYVSKVLIYKYLYSDVPTSVSTYLVGKYVPVGETFNIYIPLDKLKEYMSVDRPLRLLVETDKGNRLIGMATPNTKAVINIYLPSYDTGAGDNLYLEIICPGGINSPEIQVIPAKSTPIATVTQPSDHVYSVETTVYGIGACKVVLKGSITERYIGPANGVWPNINNQQAARIFGYQTSWSVDISTTLPVRPGGVVSLDIKIPEVIAKVAPNQQVPQVSSHLIDFSWYFMGEIAELTQPYISKPSHGNLNLDQSEVYKVYSTIVQNGVVIPQSPEGCTVYPSPTAGTPPSQVLDLIYKYAYQYQWCTPSPPYICTNYYQRHTGLPLVIYGYPTSCSDYDKSDVILDVTVPITLGEGRWIVIPIFTYDDKDNSNNLPVSIYSYVTDSNGNIVGAWNSSITDSYESTNYGPFQIALPILANTTGPGQYTLHIVVRNSDWPTGGSADYVVLVLSKIVMLRIPANYGACVLTDTDIPTLPFAEVDLNTNSITRIAPVVFNPLEKATPATVSSLVPNLALYSTSLGITTPRTLTFTSTSLTIGGFVVNDVRPSYIATGYEVTVTPSIPQATAAEVFLLAGTSADDIIGLQTSPYPGISSDDLIALNVNNIHASIVFKVEYLNPSLLAQDTYLDIRITIPETGEHYILIGMTFFSPQSAYGWARYPWVDVSTNGPTASILYPANGDLANDYGANAEIVIKVDGSGTVDIKIYPGYTEINPSIVEFAIGHIIVVNTPPVSLADYVPAAGQPGGSGGTGIYLENAQPSPFVDYVQVYLVKTDDGSIIGFWSIPAQDLTGPVLLSYFGITGVYTGGDIDTVKYLAEYVPYELIVYGVTNCQGTIPSIGTGTGSSSGGSSGGSTTPTVTWYKTPITVTSQNSITGYQLKITIPSTWDGWTIGALKSTVYFEDSNGNPLYFWIQSWDPTSKTAVIWVKYDVPAGTSTIYMYWSPDSSATNPYSTYNDPSKVFLFFDDFETWTGWNTVGSGVVKQDTTIYFHGSASLRKDTYCDPNGGYKLLPTPIPGSTPIVLEAYVYRSQLTPCPADRFGLDTASPLSGSSAVGIGPIIMHYASLTTFNIEEREGLSTAGTLSSSSASISSSLIGKWVHVVVIYQPRGWDLYIQGKLYSGSTLLGSVSATLWSVPSQWAAIYVFGGYPYNIDLLFIHKYASPAPTVTVSSTSTQV